LPNEDASDQRFISSATSFVSGPERLIPPSLRSGATQLLCTGRRRLRVRWWLGRSKSEGGGSCVTSGCQNALIFVRRGLYLKIPVTDALPVF